MTRNKHFNPSHPWPTLNRLMVNETIVNTMISIPMYLLTAWLTFPQTQPIPLWGLHGVAFDLIPATFIPAIIMALATTLVLRARIRKGMTAAGRFSPPLPRQLPLRLLVIGAGALIIMVPITRLRF